MLILWKRLAVSVLLVFLVVAALSLAATSASAKPLIDSETGLQLNAPKKFQLTFRDGIYSVKKKNSKTRADLIIGLSPLNAKLTADDYIASSGFKVSKYAEQGNSVLLTGKIGKKNVQVKFRPIDEQLEIITYFGTNKKKKKKKKRSRTRSTRAVNPRVTAAEIRALDRILNSRSGGRVIPLPVTVPMRRFSGPDGTSALVPNLPGWSYSARDGIVVGGNPSAGIINLGVPTLVIFPGLPNYGIVSPLVTADTAIRNVWPQQLASQGGQVQVLAIQQVPGSNGWLGSNFASSGLFAVRFNHVGRTWQALFVSGSTPIDSFSWFWYHSYIAVVEGSSPAIGTALMNTWATWDNSDANEIRLQNAIKTLQSIVPPGSAIDPGVFDAIHEEWVDFIRK